MRYSRLGTIFLLSFGFCATEHSKAASWTVLSQSREVSAVVSASLAPDADVDSNEVSAPDFGLFEEDVRSAVSFSDNTPGAESEVSTSARATQTSIIATNHIVVSGSVGAGSMATGSGTQSETDAFSDLSVQFALTEPGTVTLTGTTSSFDFGQVRVQLNGPGVSFEDFVQGVGDGHNLQQEFALGIGTYTFTINTFADFETFGDGSGGQSAEWDIELALIECVDPPDPHEVSAFYGIDAGSSTVHQNVDLTGGLAWGSPGDMGGGLTGKGLSVNPTTNVAYVLVNGGTGDFLASLDPGTGNAGGLAPITHSDPLALPGLINIAFDASGTLYCLYEAFIGGFGSFGTVDVNSGFVSPIGGLHVLTSTNTGLAFDPVSGQLYYSHGSSLNTVNLSTGALTPVALTTPPEFTALAFDPAGAPMIACTSAGNMVQISPSTGVVTPLSGAIDPPVPLTGLGHLTTIIGGGDPACQLADGDLGDTDGDGSLSSADISGFIDCLTGPGGGIPATSSCLHADTQADGDVDLIDFSEFAILLAAP